MDMLNRRDVQKEPKEAPKLSYTSNIPTPKLCFNKASGKKLSVASKRPPNATLAKSQTLPRSMGSRTAPIQPVRPFNKLSSTPPAVKKQLSVPGTTGSPARKAAGIK
jgi:hypothetical protein